MGRCPNAPDTTAEARAREPASEPPEDWELVRLIGMTGLRLEAAVVATIFRVDLAPFSPLGSGSGGGGISRRGASAEALAACLFSPEAEEAGSTSVRGVGVTLAIISCRSVCDGSGGGGISLTGLGLGASGAASTTTELFVRTASCGGVGSDDTAVLPEDTLLPFISSSFGPVGEAKRAVGRGPDADGPLFFFRIVRSGGGLVDEGVGDLRVDLPERRVRC